VLAAEKYESNSEPQLWRCESNKNQKKNRVRSEEWSAAAEFLEIVSRGELITISSLIQGHVPDAILKVERARCLHAV
jgi:hypothetical protein